MMLSELINKLEKIYAEVGNIIVVTGDNEWLTLENISVDICRGPQGFHIQSLAPDVYVMIDQSGDCLP